MIAVRNIHVLRCTVDVQLTPSIVCSSHQYESVGKRKNQHAFFKSPEYISEYISHDVALAWLVRPQWPVACVQTVVSKMGKHPGAPQRAAAIAQSIFLGLFLKKPKRHAHMCIECSVG